MTLPRRLSFDFGEVIENERLLNAIVAHEINNWVDYEALDSALYFGLAEFNMNGGHYIIGEKRWIHKNRTSIWIQNADSFTPCGWFRLK